MMPRVLLGLLLCGGLSLAIAQPFLVREDEPKMPPKFTNRVEWTQQKVDEPTWVNQAANNRNLTPKTDFAGTKLGPCEYLVNCGR